MRTAGPPGPGTADARAVGARTLTLGEPDYPAALLALADPPEWVQVEGVLPLPSRSVAIVGARAATPYGLGFARRLAADLAGLGLAVVSGLARGVDSAAHAGALEAGGVTVAVLPFPLAEIPAAGAALAARIAAGGALLTEQPPGAPAYPGVFLARNRLIAALSSVVVVVEAAEKSGALSTAAAARRLQRPVLAVPGDVDRETSRGANHLLRTGARVCAGAADVLAALEAARGEARDANAAAADSAPATAEAAILEALGAGPLTTDAIAARTGHAPGETLAALFTLQIGALVEPVPGQRWRRRRRG